MTKEEFLSKIIKPYTVIGFLFIITSIIVIFIPLTPYIVYRINPKETEKEIEKITEIILDETKKTTSDIDSIPAIDISLPTSPYLVIPSINVYSPISSEINYNNALKKGTWLASEYGTPENGISPIILAAHRFGYVTWDSSTRNRISFYNLPKTKVGEIFTIIWNQREYNYKVYKAEESTLISDYSADLILYTCKYFNSPMRVFRYAQLQTP